MNAYSTLSELLYALACYEKGRIKTRGLWGKCYTISLANSLACMNMILEWMYDPMHIQPETITWVESFCVKNMTVKFPQFDIEKIKQCVVLLAGSVLSENYRKAIILMRNMVSECIMLLKQKKKGYKERVAALLKAFHNLPKIFLGFQSGELFKLGTQPISIDNAFEYASSYVDLNSIGNR